MMMVVMKMKMMMGKAVNTNGQRNKNEKGKNAWNNVDDNGGKDNDDH